jgi:transcription initiation factor TFIID subunit 11
MVSTAVRSVTKLFAGEIIEQARQVQAEFIAAGEQQADLPTPPTLSGDTVDGKAEEKEAKRGPLRPEHLREAWRRYRFTGESRGVGMQQLWHSQQSDGVERFSTRTGKRLFK